MMNLSVSVTNKPDDAAPGDPDARLAVSAGDQVHARCALWWTGTPVWNGMSVGAIGAFEANDREGAALLLNEALHLLATRGCQAAIGPMDQTTWRRYRLVTEFGAAPPFALEPWNPPEWVTDFERAGFEPIARYESAVNERLEPRDLDPRVLSRMDAAGIRLRPLRADHFDAELATIFDVTLASFAQAFLYTPIGWDEFRAMYAKVQPLVVPDLVWLAECGESGECVGYVFCLPDWTERERGAARIETAIVKTIAVRQERRFAGLGSMLLDRAHGAIRACGFRRAIHALMHEHNQSRRLSGRSAERMRGYALFGRTLAAGSDPKSMS